MKSGLRAAIAAMTLMAGLAGCASTSDRYPQTPVPAPAAIDVSGRDVAAVAVRTIYADVPGGRIIGYHYDGADLVRGQGYKWDRAFENEAEELNELAIARMEEAGYTVVAAQDAAGQAKAVQLDGAVGKLTYNSYAHREEFNQATCEIRWSLFRPGESRPFYTATTPGAGRRPQTQPGAIVAAFEVALGNLLADPAFVKALQTGAAGD
jgi:hypothetical protein